MTDSQNDYSDPAELRKSATLSEYQFDSALTSSSKITVRLREAWNNVATKWQVRPLIEQQSAFNRALVDRLERLPEFYDLEEFYYDQDRRLTETKRDAAALMLRLTYRQGQQRGARRKIAYFSPLPPSRSGIADYSAELLPSLAGWAEVTVFTDRHDRSSIGVVDTRPERDYLLASADYGVPLYQMGNSDQHEAIYDLLLQYPGIVVLHDFILHHFFHNRTVGRADWTAYELEMGYKTGRDGRLLVRAIQAGEAEVPLFEVALNERVIDAAVGMIVHSHFVAERIRQRRPDIPLAVIPALVEIRPGQSLRGNLDLAEEAVLFGSFGLITAEKHTDLALRSFSDMRRRLSHAHYLLVGEAQPDVDLNAVIAGVEPRECVHQIGYVTDLTEFVNWIHTVDVVVNLRYPTVGETSAVALRAMAAARPLIVYDHGWYSELPDEAALKVPPGDEIALQAAMERLAQSAELRRSMGRAGYQYVREHCTPAHVAGAYIDFIDTVMEPSAHA